MSNLKALRRAILKLIAKDVFFEQAHELWGSEISQFSEEAINLEGPIAKQITQKVESLKLASVELNKMLEKIVSVDKENTIYIKFPQISDLNDLATAAGSFNIILSQIILEEEIGGQIKIEAVENGSIWFEIFVGSVKAASIIGAIAYSAALAYREIQKGLYISETRRTRKIQNDAIEALQRAQKLLLDDLIDAEAQNINNEFFTKNDPERIARIRLAINMLSEEMNKGAEIHPSLKTPEDVSKLFPDMKNLLTMVSRIKEIPNKKNKDDDQNT